MFKPLLSVLMLLWLIPSSLLATNAVNADLGVEVVRKKVLNSNKANSVNKLTQDMIVDANTVYVIQGDFVLGSDIRVPSNSVLEFDGGCLRNGNLIGNGTSIVGKTVLFDNVHLSGSFISEFRLSWFKTSRDETLTFQNIIDVLVSSGGGVCHIDRDIFINHLQLRGTINREHKPLLGKIIIEGDDVHKIIATPHKPSGDYLIALGNYENKIGLSYRPIFRNLILDGGNQDIVIMTGDIPDATFGCDILHCFFSGCTGENSIGLYAGSCTDCTIRECTFMGYQLGGIGVTSRRSNVVLDNCFIKYFKYGYVLDVGPSGSSEGNMTMIGGAFMKCLYNLHYINGNNSSKNVSYFFGTNFAEPRPNEKGKTLIMSGAQNYGTLSITFCNCIFGEYGETLMDITAPSNIVFINCKSYDKRFTNTINIASQHAWVTDISSDLNYIGNRDKLSIIGKNAQPTKGHSSKIPTENIPLGYEYYATDKNMSLRYNTAIGKDKDGFAMTITNWFEEGGLQYPMKRYFDSKGRPADIFTPVGYRMYDSTLESDIVLREKGLRSFFTFTPNSVRKVSNGVITIKFSDNVKVAIPIDASKIKSVSDLVAYIKQYINTHCTGIWASDYNQGLRIFDSALYYHGSGTGIDMGRTGINASITFTDGGDALWVYPNGFTATKRKGSTSSRPQGKSTNGGELDPKRDIGFEYFDTSLNKPIYASAISSNGMVTWVDATGKEM